MENQIEQRDRDSQPQSDKPEAVISLRDEDVRWCVRRLPPQVKTCAERVWTNHSTRKLFIAGGFIRSCIAEEPISDVDLLVDSKETAEIVVEIMTNLGPGKVVARTGNAITIRGGQFPIQVITRWTYSSPIDLIKEFDFTVSSAVIHLSLRSRTTWHGICHPLFYNDLAAKRIRYTFPDRKEDAGGSALRILKYLRKGYDPTLESYAGVISRLVHSIQGSESMTEEQRAKVISGLLYEVDPAANPEEEIVK